MKFINKIFKRESLERLPSLTSDKNDCTNNCQLQSSEVFIENSLGI